MELPKTDAGKLELLINLEPRFGAWLAKHILREDQRTMFWVQGWAAEILAEALIAGDPANIESFHPFLVAIDEIARWDESTRFSEPGDKFALHLGQALKRRPDLQWDPGILPHTLYTALQNYWSEQDKHTTTDYGSY